MYLKSIEIQGFKSFANKIKLDFNPGMIAIVGPNGSGKSNIVDAVRWVLGEQSAKSLRGSRMNDIIFYGSETRKGIGMSQVVLTLDNSQGVFPLDYGEITVARRLYRSGESEYFINKSPCRMKDIRELFMDTGVGREGFSIIGQGKIDEILSARPEQRRNLIEEAAGIVKYRYRKTETERKLERTENNLNRVRDIAGEISSRIGPLREQAEKAELYGGLKQELDTLEISMFVHEMQEKEKILCAEKKDCDSISELFAAHSAQLGQKSSEMEGLRSELSSGENNFTEMQQKYYEKQSFSEKLEERKKQNLLSLGEKEDRLGKNKEKISLNTSLLAEKETEESAAAEKTMAAEQTYAGKAGALKEIREEMRTLKTEEDENRHRLDELNGLLFDLMQEHASSGNRIAGLEQQISSLEYKGQDFSRKLAEKNSGLDAVKDALETKEREKRKLAGEIDGISSECGARNSRQDELERCHESKEAEMAGCREDLNIKKARLTALEEMMKNMDGFSYGVRSVFAEKKLEGICGTVESVLDVSKGYEKAVEAALGAGFQFIITENDSYAEKAVEYLRKNKKGRATFLPLNTIKTGERRNEGDGVLLGCAAGFVECSEKYRSAVEHLLSDTAVAENLEQALAYYKKTKKSGKIVTLQGEVLSARGAITGGSYNKGPGVFERKSEMSRLRQETDGLLSRIETAAGEYEKLAAEIKTGKEELAALLEEEKICIKNRDRVFWEIESLQKEKEELFADILLTEREKEECLKEKAVLEKEKNSRQEAREKILLREEEARESVGRITAENSETGERYRLLWDESVRREAEREESAAHFEEARSIQDKINFEIRVVRKTIASLEEEVLLMEQETEQLREEQAETAETLKTVLLECGDLKQGVAEIFAGNSGMKMKMEDLEKAIRKDSLELEETKNRMHMLELKIGKSDSEIGNLEEKLSEKHGLTYAEAVLQSITITDLYGASGRINSLRSRIGRMGSINFNAPEEYRELYERNEFLTTQLADLEEAKASMLKIIEEMNVSMRKKFRETFTSLNKEFNDVFKKLFGGGKASLEMIESGDVLEAGIDIAAQPPGKKMQSLNLLSGGERAMTAIALLFAILNIKPSPFCVLDEIEAALDESNARKFSGFLRDYSEKSQFIVVSHRKETMENADALYGVTMEEKGVSKVVSVQLKEAEKMVN